MIIKAGCCVIKENKVLLLQLVGKAEQNGKWGPPGGGLEGNESLEECAIREVLEETGLTVKILGLTNVILSPTYKEGYCFVFYLAEMTNESKIVLQKEEASNYIWADLQSIKTDKYPLRKEFLKGVLMRSLEQSPVDLEIIQKIKVE